MCLGDFIESWVIGFLVPDERAVCLDNDAVLVAEIDYFSLLREWM